MGLKPRTAVVVLFGVLIAVALTGCGSGGGQVSSTPAPPDGESPGTPTEVGPFVIETAATADLQMQTIPNESGAAFVAVHGASLEYVAAQEMLDQLVFSSTEDGSWDIWVSDMWGDNRRKITDTTEYDRNPAWSPDGSSIAFDGRATNGGDADIYTVSIDGGAATNLTNHADDDRHPTWAPNGERLAFQSDRDGSWSIYSVYATAQGTVDLTSDSSNDYVDPEYSPDRRNAELAFSTNLYGNHEICVGSEYDIAGHDRITDLPFSCYNPTWTSDAGFIAYEGAPNVAWDILEMTSYGQQYGALVSFYDSEHQPSYSFDGRFVAYYGNADGPNEILVVDRENPTVNYRITDTVSGIQIEPDLGNPTLQTSRVLIGPSGADRGFDPPITPSVAYGAVMAFDDTSYLNFVRIGIYSHHADELQVTPQDDAGDQVVALEVTAPELINVVQDSGAGEAADKWSLAGDTTAALLLFNAQTGKLSSVLALEDTALTAAAGSDTAYNFSQTGNTITVQGDFSAAYDATGEVVAEGDICSVQIDPATGCTLVQ